MKAMIFAAGLGTRLRPLTDNCPKALIKVGGTPMLERVINKLKSAGVAEMVINVHHLADKIKDFLKEKNYFDCIIHISDEREILLDTGGGILNARRWLDGSEPFIVHNADIFTDFDMSDMIASHEEGNADVTLLVGRRDTSRYLLFDGSRMVGWENKKTGEIRSPWDISVYEHTIPLAFGGVHIMNPSVFEYLEKVHEKVFSITPFYTDYCKQLLIQGFIPSQQYNWVDIGRPESLNIAENIVSGL